jgi:hypothetical protein
MSNKIIFADTHDSSNCNKKKPFNAKDSNGHSCKKRKNTNGKGKDNPKRIKDTSTLKQMPHSWWAHFKHMF